MMDFVMPRNNEEEFILMAEKLGYKELFFLYDFDNYSNEKADFINKKIKISNGIIADHKNIDRINSKAKNHGIFVAVKSSIADREIIEKNKADLIFGFEESSKRDVLHQRSSGLDHILCKLAHDNNITLGFSFSSLLNFGNRHILLGRMAQNLMLCRKYNVKTAIASYTDNPFQMRSQNDVESLFRNFGQFEFLDKK